MAIIYAALTVLVVVLVVGVYLLSRRARATPHHESAHAAAVSTLIRARDSLSKEIEDASVSRPDRKGKLEEIQDRHDFRYPILYHGGEYRLRHGLGSPARPLPFAVDTRERVEDLDYTTVYVASLAHSWHYVTANTHDGFRPGVISRTVSIALTKEGAPVLLSDGVSYDLSRAGWASLIADCETAIDKTLDGWRRRGDTPARVARVGLLRLEGRADECARWFRSRPEMWRYDYVCSLRTLRRKGETILDASELADIDERIRDAAGGRDDEEMLAEAYSF